MAHKAEPTFVDGYISDLSPIKMSQNQKTKYQSMSSSSDLYRKTSLYTQQYSLLERNSEYESFMVCRNEGMGVLPWSPLCSGMLTGKFTRGETPGGNDSRIGLITKMETLRSFFPAWSKYENNDMYWDLIEAMKAIAKVHGKSVPQVAIRWLLQKDVVASVIIGATSMTQLEDNMGAATGWKLTEEEMANLDTLTLPPDSYPYRQLFRGGYGTHSRYNMYNRDSFNA